MSLKHVHGNPSAVNHHADAMTAAATRMTEAAATLRQLGRSGSYRSKAVDKFHEQADQLADVMTNASVRYQHAGKALEDYWPVLRDVISETEHAISAAAHTDVSGARNDYYALKARAVQEQLNPLNDPEEERRHHLEMTRAEAHYNTQKANLASAHADYEAAIDKLEKAASLAIQRIDDGERYSHLNDSGWDDLKGLKEKYVDPAIHQIIETVTQILKKYLPDLIKFLDLLSEIASILSTILTVAAAIFALLSLIPGLGVLTGPIAGALFFASKVAGVIALGASLLKTALVGLQFLMGDATLGQVLSAGIIAATSLVLSRLGGGKGLSGVLVKSLKQSGTNGQVARAAGEIGGEVIGQEVDIITGSLGGTAETFLDQKWSSAPQFWETAADQTPAGQFLHAIDVNATVDVAPMTTDFSNVDVDAILGEAFGGETVENRGMVATVGSTGGVA